jgi:hypothetical protein
MDKVNNQGEVVCKALGKVCNICGGIFDGGDICNIGKHQIGLSYPDPNFE